MILPVNLFETPEDAVHRTSLDQLEYNVLNVSVINLHYYLLYCTTQI